MKMNVTTACRNIDELTPLAQTACKLFLATCKAKGINIFVTETYRSQDRQNYLYTLGRTRSGNIVTWTHSSRHTSRRAWDIACNGNVLYDKAVLKKAGAVAKELGITWGGTWSTPDMPHFEVAENWKDPKGATVKTVSAAAKKEDREMDKTAVKISVNGTVKTLEGFNVDGTNYVTIRALCELLGVKVGYDSATKTVVLSK